MVSIDWINKQMAYLSSNLGIYKLHAVDDFFFEPTPGFYGFIAQGNTEALNEGMQMLSRHIESPNFPIIEEWQGTTDPLTTLEHDFTADDEPPGLIKYDGPYRSKIQLCITNKHSPFVMGAILAHELTHYYLFNKRIYLSDEIENERFTDLATVYLGLGKLTLNGYDPITWKITRPKGEITYTYRVGYLSPDEMAMILYSLCKFRNIPLEVAEANLSQKSIKLLLKGKTLIDSYEKEMQDYKDKLEIKRLRKEKVRKFIKKILPWRIQEDAKISKTISEDYKIVICDNCNQKMRIPIKEKALRIKCPKCKNSFIIYPE
jgi:predicted RNA-binding Zn-ribbon protein involved in translation (DUF1610 family)